MKEPITVDSFRREVFVKTKRVDFPPKEYDILAYLEKNRGRCVDREELSHAIESANSSDRAIDQHVARLRRRLKGFKVNPIETVSGYGYRWARF